MNNILNCWTCFTGALFILSILQSCSGKHDKEGRLMVASLTTSSGNLRFSPMVRADSASVLEFKPDTFYLGGKPYTGPVAQYENQKLSLEGFLKNGVADSVWKFYYGTGGLRVQGKYVNGHEVGLWRSYYGYDKPRVDKLYDEHGFMLMRKEYFDNGKPKNYQNVRSPLFGNQERRIQFNRRGLVDLAYVEDSLLEISPEDMNNRVMNDLFMKK